MTKRQAVPRIDPTVWHHPKVEGAAVRLGITPYQAVYHLHRLWLAAHKQGGVVAEARIGDSPVDIVARVAYAADYKDDPRRFVRTLLAQKLLEQRDQSIIVHDWQQWNAEEKEEKKRAAKEAAGNKPVAKDGPQGDKYAQFIWWVTKGFGSEYSGNNPDGRAMKGAGALTAEFLAEFYVAISSGRWGDDFNRRSLSVAHVISRANAYKSWKVRRKVDGTSVPLTEEGARFHADNNGANCRGMAGAADGEAAAGDGAPDPFAGREDIDPLDEHPKLFD